MHSTKYRDLIVLFILLDEVESRSRELAERFPELRKVAEVAEATSNAASLCDLAVTVEEIES